MSNKKTRTRFAPSPTGFLHIGGLRTALYAFLYAKQHDGDFLLRIEDTDQARKVEGAVENMLESLYVFDIINDEGPKLDAEGHVHEVGEKGPYTQSERLSIYQKYIDKLVADGKAYHSFKTSEELQEIRKRLDKEHRPMKRADLEENYTEQEVKEKIDSGMPYVVRLELPKEGEITFNDLIRGEITFKYQDVDDQVILKSDGFPTYHLASVVDDALMEITHVIRGEEWISSVPKHLYLYDALGFERPEFAHLPLILNPDKSKLSKRQGDVAVESYLAKGYLPEALLNFVALLGWNPGEGSTEEFFTLDELLKQFSIKKINKAGAVFDTTKLDWMNGKYLREKITIQEFLTLIFDDLKKHLESHTCGAVYLEDQKRLEYFAQLIRERIDRLDQVTEWFEENQWLDNPAEYDVEKLTWKKSTLEDAGEKLSQLLTFIQSMNEQTFDSIDTLESEIKNWIQENEFGVGDVLWPMRVALTGQDKSPNPFEIAFLVGQEETVKRIQSAINAIQGE